MGVRHTRAGGADTQHPNHQHTSPEVTRAAAGAVGRIVNSDEREEA